MIFSVLKSCLPNLSGNVKIIMISVFCFVSSNLTNSIWIVFVSYQTVLKTWQNHTWPMWWFGHNFVDYWPISMSISVLKSCSFHLFRYLNMALISVICLVSPNKINWIWYFLFSCSRAVLKTEGWQICWSGHNFVKY